MKRTLLLLAMPLILLNAWGAGLASPNAKNDEEETPWVIEKEGKNLMEVRINSCGFIWVKNPSYNALVNSIQEVGNLTKAYIQSQPKEHIISIGTIEAYGEYTKNALKVINDVEKEIDKAYQELRNDLAKQKYGKSFSKLDADKKKAIRACYPYRVLRMKDCAFEIKLPPLPEALPATPEVLDVTKDKDETFENETFEEEDEAPVMFCKLNELTVTGYNPIKSPSDEEDDRILDIPEESATFPGDIYAWLHKNIKYPPICQELKIQGRVSVEFIINKDGSVSNVIVLRSPAENLSKEVIRVVKAMPKWKPARMGNKPVRMRYVLSTNFELVNPPSQQK